MPDQATQFWLTLAIRLITAIASVATFLSIAILFLNYRAQRKTAKVTLLNEMDREFSSNYSKAIRELRQHAELATEAEYEDSIGDILQFWEKVSLLVETDSIDLATLDDMFSYRFFIFIHNRHVQDKYIFGEQAPDTKDRACDHHGLLFYLHAVWTEFRRVEGRKFVGDRCLADASPPDYHRVLSRHLRGMGKRGLKSRNFKVQLAPRVVSLQTTIKE